MRIRIHPETTDGKPIPGTGQVLAGGTPAGLVEAMHQQTPFSAELPVAEYRDEVLLRVEGTDRRPLPEDPAEAAIEFLARLAVRGRIEFLPDGFREETQPATATEASACAGK